MTAPTDAELLQRFATTHDQRAFTTLVERHAGLVYSAARRHLSGDPAAEDVAQEVFADLARKAAEVARHPSLAGWLYASTRFAALDTLRRAQRRSTRELAAQLMPDTTPDPSWDQVRPVLDAALDELDPRYRESVLLRFFGQQSFRAIGEQLGLTENAAQKRVERAIDRLHASLVRRGITGTAAALGATLAHAHSAPSAAFVAQLCASTAPATTGSVALAASAAPATSSPALLGGLAAALACAAAATLWYQNDPYASGNPPPLASTSENPRAANNPPPASPPAPTATPQSAPETRPAAATVLPPQTRHIVQRGQTGPQIAREWSVTFEELRAANPAYDFSLMAVGDHVVIPPHGRLAPGAPPSTPASPEVGLSLPGAYVVVPGDSGAKIAAKNNLTVAALAALNPGIDFARLRVGQFVRVK